MFTDPGCPFGYAAQREVARLLWHYGDDIDLVARMIVLSEESRSYEEAGLAPEMIAANTVRLAEESGLPMSLEPKPYLAATADACRAFIGAERDEPERAGALMRALRRRAFACNEPLDRRETLDAAAADAGVSADRIDRWLADDGVERRLREDMRLTRDPAPEALAMRHRLSPAGEGLRYSTASAIFAGPGGEIVAAGAQPFAVWEIAMANVAPDVVRREEAASVEEVLGWAPYPLATAEVAALRGIEREEARRELLGAGAEFDAWAGDGFWSAG